MELFNKIFRYRVLCMVNDIVKATKVIHCLNDIIYVNNLVGNAYGICIKDIACLVMSQTASFDMI